MKTIHLDLAPNDLKKSQIHTLTHEQQLVVDCVLGQNGQSQTNVVVQAVAGSGKSKTLLAVAIQGCKINPHFKMLILVYNQKLQAENQALINDLVAKGVLPLGALMVKTYHSFINLQGGIKNALINNGFLDDQEAIAKDPDLKFYLEWMKNHNQSTRNDAGLWDFTSSYLNALNDPEFLAKWAPYFNHYDVVAFDEAQDLKPAYWNLARIMIKIQNYQSLTLNPAKQSHYLFVGDQNQTIYRHEGADPRYLTLLSQTLVKCNWKQLHLSKSFRTTTKIAQLIQVFNPNHPFQAFNQDDLCDPVAINIFDPVVINKSNQSQQADDEILSKIFARYKALKANPNQDLVKLKSQLKQQLEHRYHVAFAIAKAINDKITIEHYQPSEIVVLSYLNVDKVKQSAMRIFLDVIRQILYGYFEILCGIDSNQANQVQFETFHKSKGREWKAVFVIGCTDQEVHFNEGRYLTNKSDFPNTHYVAFSRAKAFLSINIVKIVTNHNQLWQTSKTNLLPPYMARQWHHLLDLENHNVVKIQIGATWANQQQIFKKINPWFNDNCFYLKTGSEQINLNDPLLINQLKQLPFQVIDVVNQQPFSTPVPTYLAGIYHQSDGHDRFNVSDLLTFAMIANAQLVKYQFLQLANDYATWNQVLMKLHHLQASGLKNIQSNLDFQAVIDFINDPAVIKQSQLLLEQFAHPNHSIWAAHDQVWNRLMTTNLQLKVLKQMSLTQSYFYLTSSLFNQLKQGWEKSQWRINCQIEDFDQNQFPLWNQILQAIITKHQDIKTISIDFDFKIDYYYQNTMVVFSDFKQSVDQLLEQAITNCFLMMLHNELWQWMHQSQAGKEFVSQTKLQIDQPFVLAQALKIVDWKGGKIYYYPKLDQNLIVAIGLQWLQTMIANQMQLSDGQFISINQDQRTNFKIKLN